MLRIADLVFRFSDFIGQYALNVPQGGMTALVGPSGGGKTTLLDGLAGFLKPDSGGVSFDGRDLTHLAPSERPIAMIFQDFNLFPALTAEENIGLGLRSDGRLTPEVRLRCRAALEAVELDGFAGRRAAALSGGEKQRVALARALASDRKLLLLDEAFSGLDPGLRKAMLRLVDRLRRARGLTVLISIHTPEDIVGVADSVAFISEGRIGYVGAPSDFLRSRGVEAIDRYLGLP
jgi:thiamine transport system ATP-binding protein